MKHVEMIVPCKFLILRQERLQDLRVIGLAEDCTGSRQSSTLQNLALLTGVVFHLIANAVVNCL